MQKLGELVRGIDLEVGRAAAAPLPQPLVKLEHQLARQEDSQLQVRVGHLSMKADYVELCQRPCSRKEASCGFGSDYLSI